MGNKQSHLIGMQYEVVKMAIAPSTAIAIAYIDQVWVRTKNSCRYKLTQVDQYT